MSERRKSSIRRQINALGMSNGETHESRIWAQVGKALCVWLIYKYAEAVINHWEVLLVLISWLIAPDIAKKAITMKFGGGSENFTRRTETQESTVTSTTSKPREPTAKAVP